MECSRARYITSLLEQQHQQYYGSYNDYGNGNEYYEEPHYYGHYSSGGVDPQEVKYIEMELRRRNPDLLDKLKFAMSDRQYGTLLKELGKGAFFTAAILGAPFIMAPLVGAHAVYASRQKQIQRRDMGIKPRYHLRPDDIY